MSILIGSVREVIGTFVLMLVVHLARSGTRSLQLAVLRASAVDPAPGRLARVPFLLAVETQRHPRNRIPARFRDRLLAFGAMGAARPKGTAQGSHALQF